MALIRGITAKGHEFEQVGTREDPRESDHCVHCGYSYQSGDMLSPCPGNRETVVEPDPDIEWGDDNPWEDDEEADGCDDDDWGDEKTCVECSRPTCGEYCGGCGKPLCPMCFETGGGFCGCGLVPDEEPDEIEQIVAERDAALARVVKAEEQVEALRRGFDLILRASTIDEVKDLLSTETVDGKGLLKWMEGDGPGEPPVCQSKEMLAKALDEAVAAIYFKDNSDYLPALWSVVRAIGGDEAVDLLDRDGSAAFKKYCSSSEEE